MKAAIKKVLSFLLVLAVVVSVASPVKVEAATRKATAASKATKATTVKTGTTIVTVKSSKDGYTKFKAPKAGTYVITISDVKGKSSNNIINGGISLNEMSEYGLIGYPKLKTEGGKTDYFKVASKKSAKYSTSGKKVDRYLSKRTITVKLKKGQVVYMWNYFANFDTKNTTYKLNIKRK